MTQRYDLRSQIIPTVLDNTDDDRKHGNSKFQTTDLVYLLSQPEVFKHDTHSDFERMISLADTALMDGAWQNEDRTAYNGRRGTATVFLRSSNDSNNVRAVDYDGESDYYYARDRALGVCPALRLNLPSDSISARSASKIFFWRTKPTERDENFNLDTLNIQSRKNNSGKVLYHTLQIGEKDQTKVNAQLNEKLEQLYNGGKLNEELTCTGRLWTSDGQKQNERGFLAKKNPEFEYKGEKYVRRVVTKIRDDRGRDLYSDGSMTGTTKPGTPAWVKVEPITMKIRNWDDLPKTINPDGTGKATCFELVTEQAIIANIPFYPYGGDNNRTFWQNSTIRGFLNGINVCNIQQNGNTRYTANRGGDFTATGNFLDESFNLAREATQEYTVPDGTTELCDSAFEGCVGIKKITIPASVQTIGKRVFTGCDFKYSYRNKDGGLVFASELPEKGKDATDVMDFSSMAKAFSDFDYSYLICSNQGIDGISQLGEILSKGRVTIPFNYASEMARIGKIDQLLVNTNFKFYKSELSAIVDRFGDQPEEEKIAFMKTAQALGCFSGEKMKDKDGKEKEAIAQKASMVLADAVKNGQLEIGQFNKLFKDLPLGLKPNQDMLKFISNALDINGTSEGFKMYLAENKRKKANGLDLLLYLEKDHHFKGIMAKVMTDFSIAEGHRVGVEMVNGQPQQKRFSWEEAFRSYYTTAQITGVTQENRDIADQLMKLNIKNNSSYADVADGDVKKLRQKVFEEATELRMTAKAKQMPSHVLGKPFSEKSLLEQIEDVQKKTDEEIVGATRFMHQMLDKYDARNAVLGFLVDCCGTLTSTYYGRNIARATMSADDVQNLVIIDSKNKDEIMAKMTMYIDEKHGYAVGNEFDVRREFREGKYREQVFQAFLRGVRDFVAEYDKQHPDNPMKKVTVGMNNTKLEEETERFTQAKKVLEVPEEYNFKDAADRQFVLYDSKSPQKLAEQIAQQKEREA